MDNLNKKEFTLVVLNPLTRQQEIALFNMRHTYQLTVIKEMTLEEIQKEFPEININHLKK